MTVPGKSRLFFALWPSERVRESIVQVAQPLTARLDGRCIQPHNLHLTLHFVGQVSEEVKQCMHEAAGSLTEKAFSIDLDNFDHFHRANILWMGARKVPAELTVLYDKLGEALSYCGYEYEKRRYTPHVSIMRKCRGINVAHENFSIYWKVNEFVLVRSEQGVSSVNYQVVERYPLS